MPLDCSPCGALSQNKPLLYQFPSFREYFVTAIGSRLRQWCASVSQDFWSQSTEICSIWGYCELRDSKASQLCKQEGVLSKDPKSKAGAPEMVLAGAALCWNKCQLSSDSVFHIDLPEKNLTLIWISAHLATIGRSRLRTLWDPIGFWSEKILTCFTIPPRW